MPVPERWRAAARRTERRRRWSLGIRPENIREAVRDGGGGTVPVTGEVEFVEPLGHEVIVHGRVGDDLLVAKVDPHRAPEMGSEIDLRSRSKPSTCSTPPPRSGLAELKETNP